MAFWDTGIGDLESMGVTVSAAQHRALHEGGEVLVIQHLLSPSASDGDDSGMWDQDGEAVFIPQLMVACPPEQAAEDLENWFGNTWRSWPSYTGFLEESTVDQRFWNDETTFMRVWEGLPIQDVRDKSIFSRIAMAARERIYNSVYEQICTVYEFDSNGESGLSLDELLPLVDMLASEDDPDLSFSPEYCNEPNQDYLVLVAKTMKELLEGNYLSFDNYNVKSNNPNRPLNDCTFEPMSTYLGDDYEALAVWNRLVNRRENALAVIAGGLSTGRGYLFDHYERST